MRGRWPSVTRYERHSVLCGSEFRASAMLVPGACGYLGGDRHQVVDGRGRGRGGAHCRMGLLRPCASGGPRVRRVRASGPDLPRHHRRAGYSASMVLLDAARRKVPAPPLARWLLAAGIGATIAVNVAAGAAYGPLGAAVAAWPALALVGSYELLMWLVRTAGVTTVEGSAPRAAVASAGANAAPALPALAVPVPEPARTPEAETGVPRQSPARSPRRRPRQAARQGHA